MYNDTIKVANKIITDTDLMDIFQKMDEELRANIDICRKETSINSRYEREYQNWTTKSFEGKFKCTFYFYDDTSAMIDNYNTFVSIFNNRLHEIKSMNVAYHFSYWIQHGKDQELISKSIYMDIYENKMNIDFKLSSQDNKMEDIYNLIKDKISNAPERYDRVVKKKNSIKNKAIIALGIIPSTILCVLLVFIPIIRKVYGSTYIVFPLFVFLLAYALGFILFAGYIDQLYSTIAPKQKYSGYDYNKGKSIYEDDMDDFLSRSEIIIGKNANNLEQRKKIVDLDNNYSKMIPIELLVVLVLSIVMVIVGKVI